MMSQNKTLVAKLGWKMLKEEDLYWVKALKNKYLKNKSFLEAHSPLKPHGCGRVLLKTTPF